MSSGKWHFLSPSVNGVTAGDFFFDHDPDVYASYYDEPSNTWEYIIGLTDPMPLGTGYKMWVADAETPVTAEMEGSIQTDDLSVDLTRDGTTEWSRWNLIGNPFSSALSCDDAAWGTNTTGVFYVYDSDYNGGDDRYRNSEDGVLDSIPISQSFFVYAQSAGTFNIPKTAQAHGGANFYKKKSESPYLKLQLNYKEYGNTMFVGFSDSGSPHFDLPGDADKLYAGSDVPQMYMMEDGRKLCMKLDQPVTNDVREVDLYLDQVADGDCDLNIEDLGKLSGTDVFLKDLKTGVEHDFSLNPSYHFQA